MNEIEIRMANVNDGEALLRIYGYYVRNTAISFEYEVPTIVEFRGRIANTLKKYPYLVAVRGGEILGYAYAGPFVGRAAYDWSAEVTIYLAPESRGQGLGRRLYEALEQALSKMGIKNLYACIGYPEAPDEYLTKNSAQFHEHLGYVRAGVFHKCGCKFGRWYDMIWMEKIIGSHGENPVDC
ncbi:MAG: GNAT family N-acetyltransferase [Lachnospiraceae bacterium]|jgi:L-amino acid N-acyltransferase YncA|nr:GNAT family N-acetyltransferase [Lachnospiraceae bacterium]